MISFKLEHRFGEYYAAYDDDKDDGSWLVWKYPYHYGINLTEEQAIKRAKELDETDNKCLTK